MKQPKANFSGKPKGNFNAKKSNENPFDAFANARKKHEVLNRKVKGEDRNVGRARAKAIDERKNKLLKDYHSSKKSNSFLDKRFGENDASLSLEEKMFMRFQKEKTKKARNSSIFNLDSTEEILTHKGKVLGESNLDDHDWVSSDDEETGKLNKEVVDSLHFGGGMIKKNVEHDIELPKKGRLDALQEIVMKSKLHKLQRKEAKEDQETEREKLDKDFEHLFASSLLDMAPIEKKRGRDYIETTTNIDNMDSYDKSLREMAYEVKAQPTDRTKTAEEIALEEQERIEELEKARILRMKQINNKQNNDDNNEEQNEIDKSLYGDKKNNKRKHKTDDEIDDTFDYNKKNKPSKVAEVEEEEDEEEDDDDNDEDNIDDGEEEDDEDNEEDDDDEEEDEDEFEEEGDYNDEDDEDDDEDEVDGEDDEEEEEGLYDYDEENDFNVSKKKKLDKNMHTTTKDSSNDNKKTKKNGGSKHDNDGSDNDDNNSNNEDNEYPDTGINIKMPHKIKCPNDIESFDELVSQYVISSEDMKALIDRILAWNSVHLPGTQGAENRNLLHNFLDIMLKHFIRVGDSLENEKNDSNEIVEQLDYLTQKIFAICQDIQDTCVSLWGRTLKIMESQLSKRLRDYAQGNRDSCWPSLGRLLLLQLLTHIFSITDLKNDIVNPTILLLCQCLAQCPVTTTKDLASGLLTCSILLEYTVETSRFVPEILLFIHTSLHLYSKDIINTHDKKLFLNTFNIQSFSTLRENAANVDKNSNKITQISWTCFHKNSNMLVDSTVVANTFLHSIYTILDVIYERYQDFDGYPELFQPIIDSLRSIRPQDMPKLSKSLQLQHVTILEKLINTTSNKQTQRIPLLWRKKGIQTIEMLNPRFQLDYTFKKDNDPDQDRVKMKQLNRQLKRETKAAMRELRRDSDFIDQERYKQVQEAHNARKEERHKNHAWMESEQATINQQVKKGKGLMKGGGSAVSKKARVKRL